MNEKPPLLHPEGEHEKTAEELAGNLARDTWSAFVKNYAGHIKAGNLGIVKVDLDATIDREIARVKSEKGSAMAALMADYFVDEVRNCSTFVVESVEQSTKEAKEKYLKEDSAG
ncbi:MAG: hypothetical protein WCW78_02180 [Candidatus Paceibacterota bacterium]|jgi:hypothetical protein